MIIFEIIFFLTLSICSTYTFVGLGQLILNQNKKNFFESIFFGFIVSTFLLTFIHFFLKINIYVISLIFLLGFYYSIKKFNFSFKDNLKNNLNYFIIFIIFIPIYLSQKYHEDFGYYHLPYVINFFNEKIIFGMANVNSAFIHNSIWLNLISLFNLNNNFNFLTLPTFLLFVYFVIFSLRNILNNRNYPISNYFLVVCLIYLILKSTRISEFGTDLPATIFSLLSIFYFLRYFELSNSSVKNSCFYFTTCFTVFSILIKFSCIPLLLLVIFIFFKDFKILRKEIFKFKFNFIYLLAFLFFIQQFIYSGCFVFPTEFTCLKMSWYDEEFLGMKKHLELINKSFASAQYDISKEDYLLNFNWFPYWFKRSYPEILEHLLTIFVPLLIFLMILKNENKKKNINFNYLTFFVFVLIGFIFWLNFSPVFRFSIPFFLSLVFLITLNLFMRKKFSNKVFLIFISITIIFNLSKNITRLINKDDIYFGIEKINNNYQRLSNTNLEKFMVYKPDIKKNNKNGWQGRLCWDIPFLCTYNEISVEKKYGYLFINKLKKSK